MTIDEELRVLRCVLFVVNKIIIWISCVSRVQGRGTESIKACTVCKEQDNTMDELCRQSTRKRCGVYSNMYCLQGTR